MHATSDANPVADSALLAPGFLALTTGLALGDNETTTSEQAAAMLRNVLPSEPVAIVFAGQVHGVKVEPVPCGARGFLRIPSCDGLCTDRENIALVIRTADCLPLVLVDPEARVCAALHAGWRGTLGNMVSHGIAAAVQLGARRDRLRLWLGPCIRGSVYQVSEELIDTFKQQWGHLGDFTTGRYLDLPRLTFLQAREEGLSPDRIVDSGLCTYSDAHTFHSHRRQGTKRGHEFTLCGFI